MDWSASDGVANVGVDDSDGLVGLARMLLYMAHNGLEDGRVVSLGAFEAMEPGSPVLELAED